MKKLSKHLTLLLALFLPLFISCSDSDDETRELELSVDNDLMTKEVDFEFEILSGNGGYIATVSETDGDKDAIVTIKGNKVTVNILVGNGKRASITITDKKNQKASLSIGSTHESLRNIPDYSYLLEERQTITLTDVNFGAGSPYTIEKIRGTTADAIVENGKIKVTSKALGDNYYKVRDRRGTVAKLTVKAIQEYEMNRNSNTLDIPAVNNFSVNVILKWGEKWEILTSTNNIIEKVLVGHPENVEPGSELDYDFLSISTVNEGKGIDSVTLKDKDGNLATVKITIE